MTPKEFVAMCRRLKEMGATKVAVSADGAFEASFGAAPRVVPAVVASPTTEPPAERDRERRDPPILTPADAPLEGKERERWRNDVISKVSS